MYLHIYTSIYIYIHIYMCNIYIYTCVYIYIYIFFPHVFCETCRNSENAIYTVHKYIHIHVNCICIYICIRVYIYMCIIYIYTIHVSIYIYIFFPHIFCETCRNSENAVKTKWTVLFGVVPPRKVPYVQFPGWKWVKKLRYHFQILHTSFLYK